MDANLLHIRSVQMSEQRIPDPEYKNAMKVICFCVLGFPYDSWELVTLALWPNTTPIQVEHSL